MTVSLTSGILNDGGAPSGGVNTTVSWTPDGTSQYLLTVSAYVSTGSTVPVISSVTGNGLTWTELKHVAGDNTGADRTVQYLFAVPAGGSAGAVSINWSTVPTKASWLLEQVAGADPSLGAGSLPQAAVSGTSSGANPSATLGTALKSGSVSYAAACFESSAGTLGAGSGYTALGQNTSQSLAWSFTEWNSAGSTTATATNTTTSNRHSIILIEIPVLIPGPQVADMQETAWTTTTTPKTVTLAGATAGDRILVLGGGDASVAFGSNEVTACTTTTTAGSTGSWTEPAEGLSSGDFDWISSATTTVSATGSVTVQMDRTKNGTTGGSWGFYALLIRGDGGIGNVAGVTTAGSSQTVSLTTSQDSLVAFISCDWDAAAFATGLTPAGGTDVERSAGSDFTVCAGYWRGQSAATTSYGGSGGGASSKYRCLAIEVLTLGSGVSGTAANTQANQASSASGQLGYSGTSTAVETADTSSATGTVVNPVTGTATSSQANQTSTATGQLGYSGTAAASQASQTSTASGVLGYTGTSAPTQANQSSSATGQLGYAATSAVTQAANTSTASGTFTSTGISGSAADTQAPNTSTASGQLGYSGTSATTQAPNTSSGSGQLGYTGTSAAGQAAQTSSGSGTYTSAGSFTGSAANTQANQTSSASGQLRYAGTSAPVQAGQTSTATGTVANPVTGTATAAQANQVSTASGVLRYSGTSSATQAANISAAVGVVSGPITGSGAAVQANQTATATGTFAPLVLFGTASAAVGAAASSSPASMPVPVAAPASMPVPTATGG